MGCGCGKKGNRAKNLSSKGKSPKSRANKLRELWSSSKKTKKKTKVTRINNKT